MRRLWYYYIYLFIAWGSFRYFVSLPEVIEELWFKPMIWLIPLFWWGFSMKEKIEMFGRKGVISVVLGILVGAIYFLLIRRLDISGMKWEINLIGIALATAITEEMVFSGFVIGYLEKIQKGKWMNLVMVGLMVAVIKLPILFFVFNLDAKEIVGVLLFAGASGVINAWIRLETGNVLGSIAARVGLNLAVLG